MLSASLPAVGWKLAPEPASIRISWSPLVIRLTLVGTGDPPGGRP